MRLETPGHAAALWYRRRVRRLVVPCLLAAACTPAETGDPTASGSSSGSTSASASGTGTLETEGTATTLTAGDGTGTGPADGTSTGEAAGSSSGGGPLVPGDCRMLLEEDPSTPDGVYTLHVGGDPEAPTFDAYCDMSTAGGGWTLVGRSVPGEWGTLPFGWMEQTGDLADDAAPYSLDASATELEFSEVLIGTHDGAKGWGADAYVLTVPPHFVFVCARAPWATTVTTVIGDCQPEDGPHHLRYIGWTSEPDIFHIADGMGIEGDGLEPPSWDTDHTDCDGGGNLHGLPGMIMVR